MRRINFIAYIFNRMLPYFLSIIEVNVFKPRYKVYIGICIMQHDFLITKSQLGTEFFYYTYFFNLCIFFLNLTPGTENNAYRLIVVRLEELIFVQLVNKLQNIYETIRFFTRTLS
jgi:hypothetical protein